MAYPDEQCMQNDNIGYTETLRLRHLNHEPIKADSIFASFPIPGILLHPTLPHSGLTLSRLAPRRGKKQEKRNLPQLMTAARHQLRRAMPVSVPSCLPASYLPTRFWNRILQQPTTTEKTNFKQKRKKRKHAKTVDPLVLVCKYVN